MAAAPMFSHVVIFWTFPDRPSAPEELLVGARHYLSQIPGIQNFHVGRMVPSPRGVVDHSYQIALSIQFETREAQDEYQVHPLHLEFVERVFKPNCHRVVVYDFE